MAETTTFDNDRGLTATVETPISRISWGGILAGTACGIALYALLSIIGISVGFAVVDPAEDQNPLSGVTTSIGVWWVVTSVISFFVGGLIAARFSGIPRSISGALHGLTVWAIGSLAMIALATSTLGSVVSGAAGALAGLMTDNSRQIRVQVDNSGLRQENRRLIEALRNNQAGGSQSAAAAASGASSAQTTTAQNGSGGSSPVVQGGIALAGYLLSSNREDLSSYLTQTMNEIRQEARAFIRPVLNRSEQQRAGEALTATYRDVVKTPGDAGQDMQALYDKLLGNDGVFGQDDREEAKQVLMDKMGLPEADADQVLTNWKNAYEGSVKQLNSAVGQLQSRLAAAANDVTKPAQRAYRQVVSEQEQRAAGRIMSETASDIYQRPTSAGSQLQLMLDKLFANNGVFGTEDRKELIALMEETTGMDRAELEQIVENWQQRYQFAVNQVADAVEYAENTAVQTAQTTTDVVASTAGWASISLILAGFAACLGGLLGRPDDWLRMREQLRDLSSNVRSK